MHFFIQKSIDFWTKNGAKMEAKWGSKSILFSMKKCIDFLLIFEPISALFWEPFWSKFASKIMPEQRNLTLRFYREFSSGSRVRAFKTHPKINGKSTQKSTTFLIEKSNEKWSKMTPKMPPRGAPKPPKTLPKKTPKKVRKKEAIYKPELA